MLSYYLYKVFENNLTFLVLLDIIRDILLGLVVILVFCSILIRGFKTNKIDLVSTLEIILVVLISFLLTTLLKAINPEIRPLSYFYPYYDQFFDSFPSRHTTIATSLAIIVLFHNLELGTLLIFLSFIIGFLSWFSLQHWFLDVLAGWFLGFIIGIFVLEIVKLFLRFYRQKIKSSS